MKETAMKESCNRRLRDILSRRKAVLLPGAANALAARLIEDIGFQAISVTGAGVTNTFLGVPDIGLITLSELASHVSAMRDVVSLPLIVDADTGFGNPINVGRTVQVLERSGANAIQLEDQDFPKKCGHFSGKGVIARAKWCRRFTPRSMPATILISSLSRAPMRSPATASRTPWSARRPISRPAPT